MTTESIHQPAGHAQTGPPPAPSVGAAMSMDRIDFLLARAEATLRAAAEARSRSPARTTPGPGFSRVADPVAAAADGLLAAAAAPLLHPGASRGGSRGGYAGEMRRMADRGRSVDEALEARAGKRTKAPPTGLSSHFNLPRTNVTPELKRDLQLIHMRGTLDPKRMYKRAGKFKVPEFSQVGRVVEGPTEFFSGRLTNRERKRTLVDEALDAEAASGKLKRRYQEVQLKQRSGKKAFYKELKARRHKNK